MRHRNKTIEITSKLIIICFIYSYIFLCTPALSNDDGPKYPLAGKTIIAHLTFYYRLCNPLKCTNYPPHSGGEIIYIGHSGKVYTYLSGNNAVIIEPGRSSIFIDNSNNKVKLSYDIEENYLTEHELYESGNEIMTHYSINGSSCTISRSGRAMSPVTATFFVTSQKCNVYNRAPRR